MASVPPKKRTVADLKNSILNTALTTHYECRFNPPLTVQQLFGTGTNPANDEYYTISCAEASLPGTSLATVELQNDHSGITERHVHRRQYDTTASFTFYVDTSYRVIKLFESWIGYIVNDQQSASPNYFYRVNYPKQYQTTIFMTKFERDYHATQSRPLLTYQYLNAYPISIDAMPVSYEGAQTLKCTVNFNFSRYITGAANPPTLTTYKPLVGVPESLSDSDIFVDQTQNTNQSATTQSTATITQQQINSINFFDEGGNFIGDQ